MDRGEEPDDVVGLSQPVAACSGLAGLPGWVAPLTCPVAGAGPGAQSAQSWALSRPARRSASAASVRLGLAAGEAGKTELSQAYRLS